jgi:hypothetical protein
MGLNFFPAWILLDAGVQIREKHPVFFYQIFVKWSLKGLNIAGLSIGIFYTPRLD